MVPCWDRTKIISKLLESCVCDWSIVHTSHPFHLHMYLYYLYYLYYLLLSGWNDHRPPPSKSSGPPLAMSPCCLQECQGAAETHDLAPILWLSDITNSQNRWITVHTDLILFNYTGLYRLIAFNKNGFGRQRSACCEVEALEPNAIGRVHWHPLALANGMSKADAKRCPTLSTRSE